MHQSTWQLTLGVSDHSARLDVWMSISLIGNLLWGSMEMWSEKQNRISSMCSDIIIFPIGQWSYELCSTDVDTYKNWQYLFVSDCNAWPWRQFPYQCLPRSVLLYRVTRRQGVDITKHTATDTDSLNWEIHCNPGYLQFSFLLGHSIHGDNEVDVTQYAWNINLPEATKPYLELCDILSHMCTTFVQLPFYSKQWLLKGF